MKKFFVIILFSLLLSPFALLTGCSKETYQQISHDEAKRIMQSTPDAIILDVRTPEEFDKKHITKALLLPLEDLKSGKFELLPDKNAVILVYCRTGRRSKDAAQILADNGYKHIYEFGGLIDWTGDVEVTDVK